MHDRNNLYPCPWNSKAVLKDLSSLVFSTVLFNCLQHVLKSAGPAELRLWTWLPHLQDWRMLEPALYLNLVSHPRHHPSSLHQLLINLVVVERWFYGSYIPVASHSQTPPQESPAFWSYLWTAVLPSWWRLLVHWFWTLLCRRRQTLPFLTDPGQHSSTCVCVRGSIIIAMTFMVHLTSW